MAAGLIFDTSIYITALRQGNAAIFQVRRADASDKPRSVPLWLSAVVLEELYVGAQNNSLKKALAHFESNFVQIGRLVVPSRTDWIVSGQVLAKVGQKYGYAEVTRARMTNDALIAISAARQGFTVRTKNAADFRKIAEFRPFDYEEV